MHLAPRFNHSKVNATRLVKGRPFTFSDGWTIPVGTRIGFATEGMQHDPDIVSNPDTFDGFRFAKLATEDANRKDGANIWAASHPSFDNLTYVMMPYLLNICLVYSFGITDLGMGTMLAPEDSFR